MLILSSRRDVVNVQSWLLDVGTHPLLLGARPHQTSPVLDVIVAVILLGSGDLLPLLPQSVLGHFLLLDAFSEIPLEATFNS